MFCKALNNEAWRYINNLIIELNWTDQNSDKLKCTIIVLQRWSNLEKALRFLPVYENREAISIEN
jgi:hypothetical protein